jgi:hypothetical protein
MNADKAQMNTDALSLGAARACPAAGGAHQESMIRSARAIGAGFAGCGGRQATSAFIRASSVLLTSNFFPSCGDFVHWPRSLRLVRRKDI